MVSFSVFSFDPEDEEIHVQADVMERIVYQAIDDT